MDRVPCFNSAATRHHQNNIDSAAARGEFSARVREELRIAMLSAMQGIVTKVPGYCTTQAGAYSETSRPYVDEVIDTLDRVEAFERFLLVLKDSECPLVAQLRVSLADVYARTTVDGVVQARSYA